MISPAAHFSQEPDMTEPAQRSETKTQDEGIDVGVSKLNVDQIAQAVMAKKFLELIALDAGIDGHRKRIFCWGPRGSRVTSAAGSID